MKHSVYRELRRQQAVLLKQKKAAVTYLERWGKDGSLETRAKHEALLAEAERQLSPLEQRLLGSWEGD